MSSLNNIVSSRRNFSPLSLAPALWLSDTGSDPAQWDDISGNNRHATQATVANQPDIITNTLNGRQVRRFNGTSDRMLHGLTGAVPSCTIFAVFKMLSTQSGYRGIIAIGPFSSSGSMLLSRVNNAKWGTYTTIDTPANSDASSNEFKIHCLIDNNTSGGLFYLNGASDGIYVGNTVGQATAHIGGNTGPDQYSNCDIAEILVFPTALSPENRRKVEKYLSDKWAITIPTVDEFYVQSLAPALWLDASDPNTLFDAVSGGNLVAADGPVARWEDKSGNGRHATQSTLANQPLRKINVQNSRDGILYDGTNDFLNLTNSLLTSIGGGGFEIITACRPVGPLTSAYRAIFGATNDLPGFYYRCNIAFGAFSSGPRDFNSVLTQNAPYLLGFRRSAGVISGSVNGKVETTTHTVTTSYGAAMYLGRESVSYFNQYHYEILVFPKALSQTQRANVELYLANKWATPVYDLDALNYFDRITAAGSSITDQNKLAVDAFIKGCKADNNWFAIKASCLLAGADSLSGALVPLVGTAPTNVGFLDADYTRINGLQGSSTLKWLQSNRRNDADPTDNCSLALWVTGLPTNGQAIATATNQNGVGGRNIFGNAITKYSSMCNNGSNNATTSHSTLMALGFVGISRSESLSYLFRAGGVTDVVNKETTPLDTQSIRIFGQGNNNTLSSDARLSFYSIGEAVDLALLNARLATYMSSLT